VDVRLDHVVLRSLEKRPERRYQQVSDVKTDVESIAASPVQAAPQAAAPAQPMPVAPAPAAPDFILCNPKLPRTAQAITVYGIIGAPLFWFLGLTMADNTEPANVYAEFLQSMVNLLSHGGGLLTAILWCVGGFKLRGLKPSGPRLIKTAVWLNLLIAILVIGGLILEEKLAPSSDTEQLPPGEVLFLLVGLLAIGFEIASLVWLIRNRAMLMPLLTGSHTAGATMPGASTRPYFSRKAIVGAAWAPFCIIAVAGFFFTFASPTSSGGPPAAVFVLGGLLMLLGISAPIGTTVLGLQAVRDVRHSCGLITGLPLALADALFFPLLLLDALIVAVCGGLLVLVVMAVVRVLGLSAGLGWGEILLIAVPFGLLVSLAVDGLIVWKAWKAANQPVSPDAPQVVPSSGKGGRWALAAAGGIVVLAVLGQFLPSEEELFIREMKLPVGGTDDVRSFLYFLEAPRNHRVTLWIESYTNGVRAPITGLDVGQELTPPRDEPFHGTAQLIFVKDKPAAVGQPPTMRCRWIIAGDNNQGTREGSFPDPFVGMTQQDSTWVGNREWTPRPGETISLLMLRGGRDRLPATGPHDPNVLRQADRVIELKARIDVVSPGQMPEGSSSRSFVP
jgi:hypothetical protein